MRVKLWLYNIAGTPTGKGVRYFIRKLGEPPVLTKDVNFEKNRELLAISTSGNSPNVVRAMEYANSIGCRTIALTGRDGGQLGPKAQLNIQIPVNHMGRIEDAHMNVCHMIGYYFMDCEK